MTAEAPHAATTSPGNSVSKPDQYQINHFSQSNPRGPEQDDVPALLRRVAESIEALGDVQIYDVILHNEITDDGLDWPSMTVYYDYPDDDDDAADDADADAAGDGTTPQDGEAGPLPPDASASIARHLATEVPDR